MNNFKLPRKNAKPLTATMGLELERRAYDAKTWDEYHYYVAQLSILRDLAKRMNWAKVEYRIQASINSVLKSRGEDV